MKFLMRELKKELIKVVEILINSPGLKANQLALRIEKSIQTVERNIKILKNKNIIKYNGSKKTGGYFITETF